MNTIEKLNQQQDFANNILEKPFRDIMFSDNKNEYIKPNGKWNIQKISKEVGLSDQTTRKFIKRIEKI